MKTITQNQQEIKNDHNENHTYVFDATAKDAINAALAINRPLLIKGEPGVGKSQLAKAAAVALERAYIPFVVNSCTEAKDLQWSFDAVARLADAQIEGALCKTEEQREKSRKTLALKRYIKPAVLWAALNWKSAQDQYKKTNNPDDKTLENYLNSANAETKGVVVLIDEIDKADSSVTNGLLEVLGSNRFQPDGLEEHIGAAEATDATEMTSKKEGSQASQPIKPLIIITTNEERTLPDAFIRRCLSVTLGLPQSQHDQIEYLVNHAEPNFPDLVDLQFPQDSQDNQQDLTDNHSSLIKAAAEMIIKDRQLAIENSWYPLPGQAEFFDLLRGLQSAKDQGVRENELGEVMESLSRFTSKKVHQT